MAQSTEASLKQIRESQRDLKSGQATMSRQIADLRSEFEAQPPGRFVSGMFTDGAVAQLNVDGAAEPKIFRYAPEEEVDVWHVLFGGADSGTIKEDGFFTLPPLDEDHGVLVRAVDAEGPVIDFLAGAEIRRHAAFSLLGLVRFAPTTPPNATSWEIGWPLRNAGRPLRLSPGDALELEIRADLSGLDYFAACVHGILAA